LQQITQLGDRAGVQLSDRRHVDDLTVDQLDAIIRPEDPDLGHAVVVLDREAVAARQVCGRAVHGSKL
jgi:hypothetical protein